MSVSVVLLTVNRYRFLDESISSLLKQTFNDWELIIIQDGNNNNVSEKVNSYLQVDNRISYYQRPTLNSIGSSINYAIEKSKGEFIAILDDDDIWVNKFKLEEQVNLFRGDNKLNLVASWAVGIDENGKKVSDIKKSNDVNFIQKTCLISNPIIHSSAMYRKETAISVGLYDENIPDYQDWDFVLKMLRKGGINIVPKFMIEYRMWEGNSTSNKVKSMVRSHKMIIKKHKKYFPSSFTAYSYNLFFLAYSKFPQSVQKKITKYFSAIKKNIFNKYS